MRLVSAVLLMLAAATPTYALEPLSALGSERFGSWIVARCAGLIRATSAYYWDQYDADTRSRLTYYFETLDGEAMRLADEEGLSGLKRMYVISYSEAYAKHLQKSDKESLAMIAEDTEICARITAVVTDPSYENFR